MFWSEGSLDALLQRSPPAARFLFASHSGNATSNALWMERQLRTAAARLRMPSVAAGGIFSRLHFAVDPVDELGGWLAAVLDEWTVPRGRLLANITDHPPNIAANSTLDSTRLDAFYSWIPWPATGVEGRLVWAGDGCGVSVRGLSALNGSVALVTQGTRSYDLDYEGCMGNGELLGLLQRAGAAAAVFAPPSGRRVFELNCSSPADCALEVGIPATMVPHDVGESLRRALQAGSRVDVALAARPGAALHAGVDAGGRLVEVGWLKFPSLLHVVWAAQWQDYLEALQRRLDAQPALVVPVFDRATMSGGRGVRARVTLPASQRAQQGYDRLELDLELGCPGVKDESCPAWDHAAQLFACCDDPRGQRPPCPACPTTLWAPPGLLVGSAAESGNENGTLDGPNAPPVCGWELGRWMTPFRRRVGRWAADASHLIPLLGPWEQGEEQRCTFTIQSTPWAGTWQPTLRLRLSSSGASFNHQQGPQLTSAAAATLLPLPFNGGAFDAAYNSRFPPFSFPTPARLRRAVVVALVTGHGSDEHGCAEFCPTSHHLALNGRALPALTFANASALWGCADRVAEGVVPNEHGTWQYGRGGWCNGKDVAPWVVDVTDALAPAGSGRNNTLRYWGHYLGKDPAPAQQAGYIMMSASLVMYADAAAAGGGGLAEQRR
jgi:hypothetical protein